MTDVVRTACQPANKRASHRRTPQAAPSGCPPAQQAVRRGLQAPQKSGRRAELTAEPGPHNSAVTARSPSSACAVCDAGATTQNAKRPCGKAPVRLATVKSRFSAGPPAAAWQPASGGLQHPRCCRRAHQAAAARAGRRKGGHLSLTVAECRPCCAQPGDARAMSVALRVHPAAAPRGPWSMVDLAWATACRLGPCDPATQPALSGPAAVLCHAWHSCHSTAWRHCHQAQAHGAAAALLGLGLVWPV